MEITNYKDKHEYTNKNGVTSVVYLMDCMELLKQVPDKYFDLAVVDPPYGIDIINKTYKNRGGYISPKSKYGIPKASHTLKEWDNNRPDKNYFDNLISKSVNQIVWGGNYFADIVPVSRGWIFWDKDVYGDGSRGELAWTSFDMALDKVFYVWDGMRQGQRVGEQSTKGGNWKQGNPCGLEKRQHPTQKPVKLYEWQFKNYAKPNDKILDTHLGSGSSRIAADKANLPFVGCELDPDYFYASVKRFKEYSAQTTMF